MSGNCATGIWQIAIRPASVMTIETTKASRGRSMKMPEIMAQPPPGRRSVAVCLHDLAGPHLLDAVDDHLLAFLHARGHDDVGAALRAGLHAPLLDLVLVVDDQHVVAGLVDLQRRLRHHQPRRLLALADDGRHELAVGQGAARGWGWSPA